MSLFAIQVPKFIPEVRNDLLDTASQTSLEHVSCDGPYTNNILLVEKGSNNSLKQKADRIELPTVISMSRTHFNIVTIIQNRNWN